jgi:predicted permease
MRFYRWWLHLYPASFRAEYGQEMCAIFARRRRDTEGSLRHLALWPAAFFEILSNAALVHMDLLGHDLKYAARALSRSPGFAITAVVVLALGIGANTAAFSITDHVLIRPLPFPDSERLVKLWEDVPGYRRMELSPANYRDWKRMSRCFAGMGAVRDLSLNLVGAREPVHVEGAAVTADLFPLLGMQPALGRRFTAEDDRESAPGTMVLSDELWQSRFGGDPGVLGHTVRLDDNVYTIIGVMPRGFYFPNREAELWTAMRFAPIDFQDRANNFLHVAARLKPDVSLAAARAEMRLVAAQLERAYPRENEHTGATVTRLRDEVSQQSRLMLWALSGAALCVLLIACANLANLQLAQALLRRKELAVRTALGAGPDRLARQLFTESLLVAMLGGLLGVLLGLAVMPGLARLVPDRLPVAEIPPLDLRVLAIALALTGFTGIGIGVIPAFQVCRKADLAGLREDSRSGGGRRERLRSALVVAEIAATIILLVGSGLFLRALSRLQAEDPGFRPGGLLTLRTVLPMPKYEITKTQAAFYSRVLPEVRALPRVTSAAYASFLPMEGPAGLWPVSVDGRARRVRAAGDVASLLFVTPGYFETMQIPFRRGRDIRESDTFD